MKEFVGQVTHPIAYAMAGLGPIIAMVVIVNVLADADGAGAHVGLAVDRTP